MKRWATPANALATVAVLVALTGTSIMSVHAASAKRAKRAKPSVTGAQVRNNSLTGLDVRNRTITSSDLSTSTRTRLRAQTGAKGVVGDPGAIGNAGSKGPKGGGGPDAARAYSYILAADTTSLVTPKTGTVLNPKGSTSYQQCLGTATTLPATSAWDDECAVDEAFFPHWAYDCDPPSGTAKYCNRGRNIGSAGAGATLLTGDENGVIGFTGDENGSFVSLMGPGNVVVSASLTLLRQSQGYHSRVACQPQVRRSSSGASYTNLGVPTIVSAADPYQLVHVSVTGGAHFTEAGDYDYQIACRLLDEDNPNESTSDWYFVTGSATATTTEL